MRSPKRRWLPGLGACALLYTLFPFLSATTVSAQLAGAGTCGPDINLSPSTINPATDGGRIREAIRCLINAERVAFILPPLSVSQRLARAADGHAGEAVRQKWWDGSNDSHFDPENQTNPRARIIAQGYCQGQPRQTAEITYTGTGVDPSGVNCPLQACSTPAAAVNWWVNISTAGHRERVLDPQVREIGVGFRGDTADPDASADAQMGTYVVNFGDCATLEAPPPPPPPPPPPASLRTIVRFKTLHINDCPEIGICDWKLNCRLGDQPGVELIRMAEANTGDDETIDREIIQESGLPVTVSCSVMERDGPFLFFDDPVWERVGTASATFAQFGNGEIQINQNTDEGDVTVKFFIEGLGSVSQGSSTPPPPPPAPRNCRLPAGSDANCGFISLECDRPLPFQDILVAGGAGGGIRVFRVVRELGLVNAEYFSEGDAEVAVCARNNGGTSCSNRFTVAFGPTFCPRPPVGPRPCPEGEIKCPGVGACRPISQCDFLQ